MQASLTSVRSRNRLLARSSHHRGTNGERSSERRNKYGESLKVGSYECMYVYACIFMYVRMYLRVYVCVHKIDRSRGSCKRAAKAITIGIWESLQLDCVSVQAHVSRT